jgi:TolB-like protein
MSIAEPAAAPRLSIVVLPFTNLSDDREQQYFADGITEDVTADLSRLAGMLVISRSTALTFKDKRVDAKQIGRELCVRYVLEGSVRRSGSQLRISAQLIDAATDAHLWTERFDRDSGDLFALQDEITSQLANALGVELIAAEAARPTEHPDALDYILRGRAAWNKGPTRDNYAQAISLFERALALDPRSVDAQSWLASALATRVLGGMTDSAAADLARAEGLNGQVLAASPRSAYAHYVKGRVLRAQNRWEEAVPEYETAVALKSQFGGRIKRSRLVQALRRVDRRRDPAAGASHPPQPARSPHRLVVLPDRDCASAPIAHRRGDRLARESAQRHSCCTGRSRPTRLRLCPQRRNRTRRRRTRRSPKAEQQRSFFQHCPPEGPSWCVVGGAEDPRPPRSHLFRRAAQGRNAGGISAARLTDIARRAPTRIPPGTPSQSAADGRHERSWLRLRGLGVQRYCRERPGAV